MKSLGISFWYAALALGSCLAAVGLAEERGSGTSNEKSAVTYCRCADQATGETGRILQILAEPLKSTGLDFTQEPLENVFNFLQSEYAIPIQLDTPAMEDAGLTPEEQVTIQVMNVSLRSALRLLLKQKQLTYVIRDEVLIITTPEEAESELVVCVYDVRDILAHQTRPAQGKVPAGPDYDPLIDAVVSCVATETWAESGGGEAEIRPLPPGLLIISQTRAVHDEITGLLATIRETLRQPASALHNQPAAAAMGRMMGGRGMEGVAGGMMETDETQLEPTPPDEDVFD
jgi:hypothetical protein